ncbi:MAG TPA: toll/interleukin-1 receptor domain-containing protein [Longimicrobium sp.]|nr:toll/interleukin-1 receptor domain-containing protein [Longimicrobium sp.]
MAYSVFVSHTDVDVKLAEAVTDQMTELFGERVMLYLSAVRLRGGEKWKEKLKHDLRASHSIISIITPESVAKPWLYAEWSHFWMEGKPYFVLLCGDVPKNRLTDPMLDSQVVDLESERSIRGFLDLFCDHASVPMNDAELRGHASRFFQAVAAGRAADRTRLVERYVNGSAPPPEDEREIREILDILYSKGEIGGYRSFFRRLRHDGIKANMAIRVCGKGEAELAATLCEDITAADHLARVASALLEAGHGDAPPTRRVLDLVAERNGAELRKLATQVFDRDGETDVFRYLVRGFRNMFELRKVAVHLVERGDYTRPVFAEMIATIARTNPTALREVALEFIRRDGHHGQVFERLMDDLVAHKPSAAIPVLQALKESDPETLPVLYERYAHHDAGNAAADWLRKELGLE